MSEAVRIPARDGRSLAGKLFSAEAPQGAVVVASAMGVPQRLYAGMAAHFAEAGLSTLTFDYRGIGGSRSSAGAHTRSRRRGPYGHRRRVADLLTPVQSRAHTAANRRKRAA